LAEDGSQIPSLDSAQGADEGVALEATGDVAGRDLRTRKDPKMTDPKVADLAREFTRRGLNRREMIALGTRLGVTSAFLGAALRLAGQDAAASGSRRATAAVRNQEALWDKSLGAEGPWPTVAVAEPAEEVELSIAHAWDATFMERQTQFDELFTERHPTIKVTAENTPWGDFMTKYTTQAAGGSLPDIMYVHFSWAQQLIQADLLPPVDDYIALQTDFDLADFTEPSLVSYTRDEQLHIIPYDEGPGILYYNKDLFDAAGVAYPDDTWTLDRLKEVALQMTTGEGAEKIFGIGDLPSPGNAAIGPGYLFPHGAQYISEPDETEYLLDQPEGIAAMEWWQELRDAGAAPHPDDLATLAWPPFQFGNIAMYYEGSWATPPIIAGASFAWDVAKWPAGPARHSTFSAGSGYAITRDARNADAAWIYLNDYLSTAGQTYMWALTGRGSPARLSAWPAYLESEGVPAGASNIQDSLTTIASHEILDSPVANQVTQTAGPIWDEVIAGNLSVEEAINEIGAAIEPLLAQNAS
jgi:multiple sugar transport system substrate-binding protein